jgi:hypothetical protein
MEEQKRLEANEEPLENPTNVILRPTKVGVPLIILYLEFLMMYSTNCG